MKIAKSLSRPSDKNILLSPAVNERQKGPSLWLRPSCWQVLAGNLEHPTADVNAARSEFSEHGPPAASADIERRSVTVMTVTVMAPMTVAMATVHAVSATMAAMTMPATVTTVTTSRSRGDSGSGQSERGDSCERDLAKHSIFSICEA